MNKRRCKSLRTNWSLILKLQRTKYIYTHSGLLLLSVTLRISIFFWFLMHTHTTNGQPIHFKPMNSVRWMCATRRRKCPVERYKSRVDGYNNRLQHRTNDDAYKFLFNIINNGLNICKCGYFSIVSLCSQQSIGLSLASGLVFLTTQTQTQTHTKTHIQMRTYWLEYNADIWHFDFLEDCPLFEC